MNAVLKQLQNLGVVPVVVLDDAKDAEALGKHCAKAVFSALKLLFAQPLPKSPFAL